MEVSDRPGHMCRGEGADHPANMFIVEGVDQPRITFRTDDEELSLNMFRVAESKHACAISGV